MKCDIVFILSCQLWLDSSLYCFHGFGTFNPAFWLLVCMRLLVCLFCLTPNGVESSNKKCFYFTNISFPGLHSSILMIYFCFVIFDLS